jgi:ABC-type transport system involved in multi-copper enzyme maturation permease subunit
MSLTLPRYTRLRLPRLGRRHRAWAIAATGARKEIRRTAAQLTIGLGALLTTVSSLILLLFASFLLPGETPDLSFFFLPASSPAILFFATLMAAVVGGGLIADDRAAGALSLYLSRPVTPGDYLGAKAFVLGALTSLVTVLPLVATALAAPLLGFLPWDVSLVALGLSVALGLLLAAFFTATTLFLSSLTSRRGYAAAGIFAVTFGLGVPSQILANVLDNAALLYLSPWDNFLAVARAVFGAPGTGGVDAGPALAILLAAILLATWAAHRRVATLEVETP